MNQKDKIVKALEELDRSPLCLLLNAHDPNVTSEKAIIKIAYIARDRLFEDRLLLTRDGIVTRLWYTAADDEDEFGRYEGKPEKIDPKDFPEIADKFHLKTNEVVNSVQCLLKVAAERAEEYRSNLLYFALELAKSSAAK